jgi:hypothetical protein
MVLIYQGQYLNDSLAIAGLQDFGQPGCIRNHGLAIIDVEEYKQNGREMLPVSNNWSRESRSQSEKRICVSNNTYNFSVD